MMILYRNQIDFHVKILQNSRKLPWIVMLHGFMCSGKSFTHLTEPLQAICNPVTIDLAGHGESGGTDSPDRYRVDEQVADLHSMFMRLQLKPLILYGYSMGGRLALQFATRFPELIDGLILESTTAGIGNQQQRRERQRLDMERAGEIDTDYPGFLAEWEKMPLFASGRPGRDENRKPDKASNEYHERLQNYRRVMERQHPAWLAASLRGFGTGFMPPVTVPPNGSSPPALLIAGEHDTKFIDEHRQIAKLLPGSTHIVIPQAGHRVHLDQPGSFIETVQPYIQTLFS